MGDSMAGVRAAVGGRNTGRGPLVGWRATQSVSECQRGTRCATAILWRTLLAVRYILPV